MLPLRCPPHRRCGAGLNSAVAAAKGAPSYCADPVGSVTGVTCRITCFWCSSRPAAWWSRRASRSSGGGVVDAGGVAGRHAALRARVHGVARPLAVAALPARLVGRGARALPSGPVRVTVRSTWPLFGAPLRARVAALAGVRGRGREHGRDEAVSARVAKRWSVMGVSSDLGRWRIGAPVWERIGARNSRSRDFNPRRPRSVAPPAAAGERAGPPRQSRPPTSRAPAPAAELASLDARPRAQRRPRHRRGHGALRRRASPALAVTSGDPTRCGSRRSRSARAAARSAAVDDMLYRSADRRAAARRRQRLRQPRSPTACRPASAVSAPRCSAPFARASRSATRSSSSRAAATCASIPSS